MASICNPDQVLGSLSSLVFLTVPMDGSEDGKVTMDRQYTEATIDSADRVLKRIHTEILRSLVPVLEAASEDVGSSCTISSIPKSAVQIIFEMIALVCFGTSSLVDFLKQMASQRSQGVRSADAGVRRLNVAAAAPAFDPDEGMVTLLVEMGFPRHHVLEGMRQNRTNNA